MDEDFSLFYITLKDTLFRDGYIDENTKPENRIAIVGYGDVWTTRKRVRNTIMGLGNTHCVAHLYTQTEFGSHKAPNAKCCSKIPRVEFTFVKLAFS